MNAALGFRLEAVFFLGFAAARFLAGMHLSFRERRPIQRCRRRWE
jgi:hypothetical protein